MKIAYLVVLLTAAALLSSGCIDEENTTNTERTTTADTQKMINERTTIADTQTTINEKTLTVGEILSIGNGMEIGAISVDSGIIPKRADSIPKQVFISLTKDGNTLDKIILENGENYHYGNILELKIGDIYSTDTSDGVTLRDIVYRPNGDAPLKTLRLLTTGEIVELGKGFTISIGQIYRESPRKALITLSESGIKKDEKIVVPGEIYNYDNSVIVGIDKIFAGPTIDIITLDITEQ